MSRLPGICRDTASLPLPDYDVLATNNAGPPLIVYELDATFHRYGASGPVSLLPGDILAASDSPDHPGKVEIDIGTLLYTGADVATNPVVDNEKLLLNWETGSNDRRVHSKYAMTKAAGLSFRALVTMKAVNYIPLAIAVSNTSKVQTAGDHHGNMYSYTGEKLRINDSNTIANQQLNTDISIPVDVEKEYIMVCGGFDASGQPSPSSDNGILYFYDSVLVYSSSHPRAVADMFYANRAGTAADMDLDFNAMQAYTDTAPLATPARSLFASDHANVADYTPDDGVDWVVASGGASTSSGNLVNGGAASLLTLAEYGQGFFEHSLAAGDGGTLFRYADTLNYWAAEVDAADGSGDLNEYNAGTPTSRGAISGTGGGRKILTDTGTDLTHISAENGDVVAYASTAGAANQVAGLKLAAGASVAWECIR